MHLYIYSDPSPAICCTFLVVRVHTWNIRRSCTNPLLYLLNWPWNLRYNNATKVHKQILYVLLQNAEFYLIIKIYLISELWEIVLLIWNRGAGISPWCSYEMSAKGNLLLLIDWTHKSNNYLLFDIVIQLNIVI